MPLLRSITNIFSYLLPQSDSKTNSQISDKHIRINIPTEKLCNAVLDKLSNGSLTLKVKQRKPKIFENEKELNTYLSTNMRADIWKILDKREGDEKIRTIFRYYAWGEFNTYSSKEELYADISSGTEHGIFQIRDTDTKKSTYIYKEKRWFKSSFKEITREKAKKATIEKAKNQTSWRKKYAVAVITLTNMQALYGIGKTFAKIFENISDYLPEFDRKKTLRKPLSLDTG